MAETQAIGIVHFDVFKRREEPRELTYLEVEELGELIEEQHQLIFEFLGQLVFCLGNEVTTSLSAEVHPDFPYTLSEQITITVMGVPERVEKIHREISQVVRWLVSETPANAIEIARRFEWEEN
jgi:hypothetical protein